MTDYFLLGLLILFIWANGIIVFGLLSISNPERRLAPWRVILWPIAICYDWKSRAPL